MLRVLSWAWTERTALRNVRFMLQFTKCVSRRLLFRSLPPGAAIMRVSRLEMRQVTPTGNQGS